MPEQITNTSAPLQEEPLIGGDAFKAMLKHVSPDEAIPKLLEEIKTAKSISKRDILIKKLKYLSGLKNTELSAKEAFVLHNIPVLPPKLRPPSILGGNRIEFADVNMLYKDHMVVNNSLKDMSDVLLPEDLIKERTDAYRGVKAILGLSNDPISPNSKARGVQGLLKQVSGPGGPKSGFFHNKLLSKKQDFSGRATIYAEPNLGFNEAAIPKDMLWTMYKFHILRDLAKQGYDYVNSEKAWKDRTPGAVNSFNKVISSIPLLINRAPTLMKSNISAMYPVPIEGNTIGLNPIHLPLFAGDYDGDALTVHTPMTPEAIEEAKQKLLPIHQIHDYRRGLKQSIVQPSHEAIIGSMHLTEPDLDQAVQKFKTEKECLLALKEGKIKENTPVEIG